MTHSDPVADLLTRLRNAGMRGHPSVEMPWFGFGEEIVRVLADEGWLLDYEVTGREAREKRIVVRLKYTTQGRKRVPLIQRIDRVSKPGRRVYSKGKDVKPVLTGLGTSLVSTSQGLLPDREARQRGLGGEVVAVVS